MRKSVRTALKKEAAAERTRLNKIRRQPLADLNVAAIHESQIWDFLRQMKAESLKDSSLYKYFTLLNDIFRHAIAQKQFPRRIPMDEIEREDLARLLPRNGRILSI